jgi:hypothetical protein
MITALLACAQRGFSTTAINIGSVWISLKKRPKGRFFVVWPGAGNELSELML